MSQQLISGFVIQLDLPPNVRRQVDLIALCLDSWGRVSGDDDVVFYNQPVHPRHGVQLQRADGALRVEPGRFPVGCSLRILVSANPPTVLEKLDRVALQLTTGAASRTWTVAGGAGVLEVCRLSASRPGVMTWQPTAIHHRRDLAAVLGDFGVAVGDAGKDDGPPPLTGPVMLPAVARSLTIRACLGTPGEDLLAPGLAAVFLPGHGLAGIAWPWDRDLWHLPRTPVRWHWQNGWQVLEASADHLADLQRWLVFLHTPHPQLQPQRCLTRCEVVIDDEPRYCLRAPSGGGRIALLARLERLRDAWQLVPDPLMLADLATLARQRQLPLAPAGD